jgi:HTH-type transcriptional regulator/antitoxin HigA
MIKKILKERYTMNIHLIKNEKEYDKTMEKALALAKNDPKPGTGKFEELQILSLLIEDYDKKHYQIPDDNDPIEVIKIEMENQGLKAKDLEPFIGNYNRVWEVLNKKRKLTINMIRKLSEGLRIPADILIKNY